MAEPGGICISRHVHDHVKQKLKLHFEYLGEQEVKNIAEPVRAYKVSQDAAAIFQDKSQDEDTEKATYSVGWAPMSGLAFVYELEESETTDSTDAVVQKTRAQGLSIVWQF